MQTLNEVPLSAQGRPVTAGCVFVPTMGALHEGHAALIRDAVRVADQAAHPDRRPLVVVSIFVNPTQFNDPKDLERYPRTLEADQRLCEQAGADIVLAPTVATVYPQGLQGHQISELPAVATQPGLEDAFRPGHFAGVCRVVARLFDLVQPSAAVFGEKDWQQLQVIRAITAAQRRPTRIVASPTIRESDGLAMSSRNRFLTQAERPRAALIHAVLGEACSRSTPAEAELAMHTRLTAAGFAVEYAVVRDAETLTAIDRTHRPGRPRPARALIAAKLGSVRLIDNECWAPSQG